MSETVRGNDCVQKELKCKIRIDIIHEISIHLIFLFCFFLLSDKLRNLNNATDYVTPNSHKQSFN